MGHITSVVGGGSGGGFVGGKGHGKGKPKSVAPDPELGGVVNHGSDCWVSHGSGCGVIHCSGCGHCWVIHGSGCCVSHGSGCWVSHGSGCWASHGWVSSGCCWRVASLAIGHPSDVVLGVVTVVPNQSAPPPSPPPPPPLPPPPPSQSTGEFPEIVICGSNQPFPCVEIEEADCSASNQRASSAFTNVSLFEGRWRRRSRAFLGAIPSAGVA